MWRYTHTHKKTNGITAAHTEYCGTETKFFMRYEVKIF
jgi:hypothetical protein